MAAADAVFRSSSWYGQDIPQAPVEDVFTISDAWYRFNRKSWTMKPKPYGEEVVIIGLGKRDKENKSSQVLKCLEKTLDEGRWGQCWSS